MSAGLAVLGRFRELVATHLGYAVVARLFPGFADQVRDLYRLGGEDTSRRMVAAASSHRSWPTWSGPGC